MTTQPQSVLQKEEKFAILEVPRDHHSGEFTVVKVGPENWVEYAAHGGRKYYHNRVTKATQWHRPRELAEQDWATYQTKEGRTYFHNRVTKKTQWTAPDFVSDESLPKTPDAETGSGTAEFAANLRAEVRKSSMASDLLGIDDDDSTPRCTEEESVPDVASPRPRSPVESLDSSTPSTPRHKPTEEDGESNHEEYYSILSVSETSSPAEVKAAYHQLARRFHPDRCGVSQGDRTAAIRKFQNAQQAYSVLSDTTKRRVYDAFVAYCRGLNVDVEGCVQEFRTFLDLCDCMGVAVQPGSRIVPVTLILGSNPNRAVKEWRQFHTPEDKRYFYNFATRITQWEKPNELNEYDVCSRLMGLRDFIEKQGKALQPAVPPTPTAATPQASPASPASPAPDTAQRPRVPPPRAQPQRRAPMPATPPSAQHSFSFGSPTTPAFPSQFRFV